KKIDGRIGSSEPIRKWRKTGPFRERRRNMLNARILNENNHSLKLTSKPASTADKQILSA
ncbi:unnamed protein product, partial [Ceratitis capitata]